MFFKNQNKATTEKYIIKTLSDFCDNSYEILGKYDLYDGMRFEYSTTYSKHFMYFKNNVIIKLEKDHDVMFPMSIIHHYNEIKINGITVFENNEHGECKWIENVDDKIKQFVLKVINEIKTYNDNFHVIQKLVLNKEKENKIRDLKSVHDSIEQYK